MKLIVCVDDANGMLFNRRRQSRDSTLCERVLLLAGDAPLRMNAYSAPLFGDAPGIVVSEDFLTEAGEGDYCFVENLPLTDLKADRVEAWYVFRWNRRYPADRYLKPTPDELGFRKVNTLDFPGHSHELITLDEYRR